MNNELEYKGYHTVIVYNSDDRVLCGKIEGINDLKAEAHRLRNEALQSVVREGMC